ncbi:MAG: pirin family protein [Alteripontixanthobacter sp.]
MIDIRPFASLGHADHGWLDARHHFSFASYHDSARMGWGAIRVWNDDTIAAQSGFPPHPHSDMEIITYVRSGAITHKDSLGNSGRTEAGDVQVMSAGDGITHSEANVEDETTTLFQIWIMPQSRGGSPRWGQRAFPEATRDGSFQLVACGPEEREAALYIRADAKILAARVPPDTSVQYKADPARHQYMVALGGAVEVNGQRAEPRDGIAITGETAIEVTALGSEAELVLVDSL